MTDSFSHTLLHLAQGKVSINDAQAALRLRAEFSFGTNPAWVDWRNPLDPSLAVPLAVDDIRNALQRFLSGTWKARDLHLWAQFIHLIGAYQFPDPPVPDDDYYDAAWDVILDLSCPEVHGLATEASVRKQLAELQRFDIADIV